MTSPMAEENSFYSLTDAGLAQIMTRSKPLCDFVVSGACPISDPGPGGWVYLWRDDRDAGFRTGSSPHATKHQMELTAVVEALKSVGARVGQVTISTDSEYVIYGVRTGLKEWKARGWRASGTDRLAEPLWEELDAILRSRPIRWSWVTRAGTVSQRVAAQIASQAARDATTADIYDLL